MHLVPGMSDFQDVAFPNRRSEEGGADTIGKFPEQFNDREQSVEADSSAPESPLSDGLDYKPNESSVNKRHRHLSPSFALCLSTFSLAFCCFLVHGAIARQPTHLLPFFFLQVFDFIISLLTVVGYMSSNPDVHLWLRTKDGAMYINSTSWTFLLLFISLLVLVFKAYCLRMVWDCYKYLIFTHNRAERSGWASDRFTFLPTIWGLLGLGRQTVGARSAMDISTQNIDVELSRQQPIVYDQSNDLPNYDDALKIPANAYAPPPYFSSNDPEKLTTTGASSITLMTSDNSTNERDSRAQ